MKLLIKINDTNAPHTEYLITYYSKYQRKFETDSGIDLVIPDDVVCPPHQTTEIHLGICCAPVTDKPCGYYLYPRSSLSNTPLRLANSIGIIDYTYRGEIIARVDNISDKEYVINGKTDVIKLFQLCAPDLTPISFELVPTLDKTARGTGGFGSTN
jgi:dUTP pyrophosphatase